MTDTLSILNDLAASQSGWFNTAQAVEAGVSQQVLYRWSESGRIERRHQGIYRLTHYPISEHEDLVAAWLWSRTVGVISHETALQLHQLSDAFPRAIHLTLPTALKAKARGWKVPSGYALHFSDIPEAERTWLGAVPLTRPARTVNDVAQNHGDPQLVEQAANEGIRRRLFGVRDVAPAVLVLSQPAAGARPSRKTS